MPTEVNEVMPGQTSELLKPAIRRQKLSNLTGMMGQFLGVLWCKHVLRKNS